MPNLSGGEGARRQTRIAEADLNLDNAVTANTRAHGKGQIEEGELEMRNFQSLRCNSDFPIGGKTRPAKAAAKHLSGVGRGNDEDRSLNPDMMTSSMNAIGSTVRTESGCGLIQSVGEVWVRCSLVS